MPIRLFTKGDAEYVAATTPANAVAQQRPAFVARPADAASAAAVVHEAAARGLRLVPQATGHGAGADVGESRSLSTPRRWTRSRSTQPHADEPVRDRAMGDEGHVQRVVAEPAEEGGGTADL